MSSRLNTVFAVASVAVVGLAVYAVYFDYKRRNDGEFRKKLRKEKKRVEKLASSQASAEAASNAVSAADLADALERVKREEQPPSPQERENYFMTQVGMGEQLAMQGPVFHLPAALAFFRALRVYPSPMELMVIYEKTVPEAIFKLIVQLMQLDMQSKVTGYYHTFPPDSMNVSIKDQDEKKIVVLTQDVSKGDIIYKELAVVAALDPDLQTSGTHCAHCLRLIESPFAIKSLNDPLTPTYCSKACQLESKAQSHNLLFSTERPFPSEVPLELPTPEALERRRQVQASYVEYLKASGKAGPLLAGCFVARQIHGETIKLVPGTEHKSSTRSFTGDDGEYGLGDHMERLRFVDVTALPEDTTLLANVLGAAVPDLEHFITDERMSLLLGRMAYNAYGVCYGGGRDDRPQSNERPEDQERTRTPYGTTRQIGSAFYTLSSYLNHSCEPSARPSFSGGTSELHLIANRDLKKGDELTVAFVDVKQHEDETVEDCRRRRRMELARGWKFACVCERCVREAATTISS